MTIETLFTTPTPLHQHFERHGIGISMERALLPLEMACFGLLGFADLDANVVSLSLVLAFSRIGKGLFGISIAEGALRLGICFFCFLPSAFLLL
jgi:hypothetical protein